MLARGLEFVMEAIDSIYNTKGRKVAPMQCEPCLYFGGFTPISRPDTLSGKRELNVQEMISEFEDAEKRTTRTTYEPRIHFIRTSLPSSPGIDGRPRDGRKEKEMRVHRHPTERPRACACRALRQPGCGSKLPRTVSILESVYAATRESYARRGHCHDTANPCTPDGRPAAACATEAENDRVICVVADDIARGNRFDGGEVPNTSGHRRECKHCSRDNTDKCSGRRQNPRLKQLARVLAC